MQFQLTFLVTTPGADKVMEALLSKDAGELEKDVIVPYDKLVTSKIITQIKNAEE